MLVQAIFWNCTCSCCVLQMNISSIVSLIRSQICSLSDFDCEIDLNSFIICSRLRFQWSNKVLIYPANTRYQSLFRFSRMNLHTQSSVSGVIFESILPVEQFSSLIFSNQISFSLKIMFGYLERELTPVSITSRQYTRLFSGICEKIIQSRIF
ncbi:Hypothetical_protein [Hexamita inflata]|uniref:Hypothetical_protein n=1 Tax=Hexamita inflata TaxID=28002 RepID=A0AA86NN96_9EUKA|nr:Hypothetical protein HINF_LOCUS11127 [Hexamita inflata]